LTPFRAVFARLTSLLTGRRTEARLDEEIHAHLDALADEYETRGMSPDDARRAARRAFGGVMQMKEAHREQRSLAFVGHVVRDLRHAVRGLARRPGFALLACAALALGIGANATVFGLANALLFRPLPVPDGSRLTVLARVSHDDGSVVPALRPAEIDALRSATTAWSSFVGSAPATLSFETADRIDRIGVAFVTENYFDALRLQPAAGTFFHLNASSPRAADPVFVASYDFWQRRFGGNVSAVGQSVLIGGRPVTIVGVAPRGFRGDAVFVETNGFIPRYAPGFNAGNRPMRVLGVLRPGITLEQANGSLDTVSDAIARERRETPRHVVLRAFPERLTRPNPHAARPAIASLTIFGALTGLVLVLACTNVAGLLLVRADGRRMEMALRAALGATRTRLAAHLFIEALVLATTAAAAGVLIGHWTAGGLTIAGGFTAFANQLDTIVDWRTLAFAAAIAIGTALVVGVSPAFRTARCAPRDLASQHLTAVPARARRRTFVIVTQTALALTLLIIAGLLTRSLISTRAMAFGFDHHQVVDFTMNPAESGYDNRRTREQYREILSQVSTLPGVAGASLSQTVPMASERFSESGVVAEGSPVDPADTTQISYGAVSAGYFATLRIPILAGRAFSDADDDSAPRAAVVSAAMAARYWPDREAVGQTFHVGTRTSPPVLVVGVAADVNNFSPFQTPVPVFYLPLSQHFTPFVTLQVRSTLPESTVVQDVRRTIHAISPDVVPFDVRTFTEAIDRAPDGLLFFRLGAGIAAALGGLGLILAVVGVYGVVAYSAGQRTREMAVRLALGAQPGVLRRNVLLSGMAMVGAGLALGVATAAVVARVTANLYVGISPLDPLTFGAAVVIVALAGLAACDAPARRVMRVDPIVSLREN
jgi:predicted permease